MFAEKQNSLSWVTRKILSLTTQWHHSSNWRLIYFTQLDHSVVSSAPVPQLVRIHEVRFDQFVARPVAGFVARAVGAERVHRHHGGAAGALLRAQRAQPDPGVASLEGARRAPRGGAREVRAQRVK